MRDEFLTVKEAAYELRVSLRTLRRWVSEGKIESREVGPTDRIRIHADAVQDAKRPRARTANQ